MLPRRSGGVPSGGRRCGADRIERTRHAERSVGARGSGPLRLVLDWDGTVTDRDTLELVIERFGDIATYRRTGVLMGTSLSHDDALAHSFATVRAPLSEVVDWLVATVRVRAGFHELVERHRPLVVSSGFHELIEPVLRREGLQLEVLANHVEARRDGWRIRFRRRRRCEECGEPCKRAALPAGDVAYVGDGYSDRCAALAATRVFATGSLARYLRQRAIAYEPFDDLHDVVRALSHEARSR